MAQSHATKKSKQGKAAGGAKGNAGSSKLRANAQARQDEPEYQELEPLVEVSAYRDIAGVVLAVVAIASFIAVVSPESAPVTRSVSSFYHFGFGLGAYVLPLVLLAFAASLFLRDRSPLNARTLAGGTLVFACVIAALSLMVPGTDVSTDGMFAPEALITSGGYVGAFIASVLQGALGKVISMVVLVGLIVVGFIIIGFSVSQFVQGAAQKARAFADRRHVDVNGAPWGDDAALQVPAAPKFGGRAAAGADSPGRASGASVLFDTAQTTLLGSDDEEEDPFVDVSPQLDAERAQTTLLPKNGASKGGAAGVVPVKGGRAAGSASEAAGTAKTTLLETIRNKKNAGKAEAAVSETQVLEPQPVDAMFVDDDDDVPPFEVGRASGSSTAVAVAAQSTPVAAAAAKTANKASAKAAPAIPDFLLNPKNGSGSKAADDTPVSLDKDPNAPDDVATVATTAAEASKQAGDGEELALPPLGMLRHNANPTGSGVSESELEQTAEALQNTLIEFGRTARVVGWISGPTVTTFKLQPGEGERVSKITALEDDIALSLAATSVRIFAPIPGTSLVGIEIPNRTRENVYLGDVLPYVKGGSLELAIGRDSEGTPIVADLAKMPHLLIAGTTGSGKSVMINSIITTLLMRGRPDDVRMIMVDPKRVELAGYNGLPHLYVPVVTEPKQAASALQWVVSEMERRLKVFEKLGVRKISDYNEKQAAGEFAHYDNPPQKMPYLVSIIDELSDLMMVAGKDVEASIVRIAQLGRAAGIHLIVATQRPSSNVVTGLIKANISNRIAFNVATGIDSRVIIDQMGAEKLTGLGDMLFSKVGWGKPRRIQGCFVSDDEINQIVEFVKSQSEPDYHEEILSAVSPAMVASTGAGPVRTGTAEPEDDDPLMWEAAKIVVESQLGSTSGLQRRLKVGYARAGRIMDMLEEKGVVGPPDGSKPREVLIDEEGLEALKSVEAQMAQEDDMFGGF